MANGCCKGCEDRKVGCHSYCEIYKNFLIKLEEVRKKRRYENMYRNDTSWGYFPRRREK